MSVGVEVVECWDRRSDGARFYLVREEDTCEDGRCVV